MTILMSKYVLYILYVQVVIAVNKVGKLSKAMCPVYHFGD